MCPLPTCAPPPSLPSKDEELRETSPDLEDEFRHTDIQDLLDMNRGGGVGVPGWGGRAEGLISEAPRGASSSETLFRTD